MIVDEIILKLGLDPGMNISGSRRIKPILLSDLLNTLIKYKTLKHSAENLGISRSTLTDICKFIFPDKTNKQEWSTYLLRLINKKNCSKCSEIKTLSEFADDKDKGKHSMCKPCLSLYGKDRYYENKNQHRQWHKNWVSNNRDNIAEKSARRRAQKLNQTPMNANLNTIAAIYKHCPAGWHVDHIIPLSKGGLHHEYNLCYLWTSDNLSKKDKMPEEVPEIMAQAIYPLGENGFL